MAGNALPPRATALLLGLAAALLLLRLGALPLVGPDEPRYARVAVEMRRSGDFVTPTLQGRPWLEKPALYYWLAGGSYALLGENETAARLPSVAAALLFVGTTSLVAARLYGSSAGLHAGFILATSLLTFVYGRAAAMDMLLAAFVTAATSLFGLRFLGIAGRLAIPGAYVCMAFAVLAKGPIGVLLPAIVVVAFAALRRDKGVLRQAVSLPGILVFTLIAAPWYALVYAAQGRAFLDVFLLNHNLERFTSTVHNHPGSAFYYVPVLLVGLFPWSGLALPAVFSVKPRGAAGDLYVLLWLTLPLFFFSTAGSKLPGYILPCLAPLAILAGRAAHRLATPGDSGDWRRPVALVGLLFGAVAVTGPFVLRSQGEPRWPSAVPACIWALVVAFMVSRVIDLNPRGALALWRVGAAGLLLLVTLTGPELLAARESGRDLFLPARGRPVLAWNAWRTAWMAGYFYNDANVREASFGEVQAQAEQGPVLVLCGPGEKRRVELMSSFKTTTLSVGARGNALLRVERVR